MIVINLSFCFRIKLVKIKFSKNIFCYKDDKINI